MILGRANGVSNATTRVKCDDAGDCAPGGNFCGVCPVIGRLRILCAAYIAAVEKVGTTSVFFHGAE